MSLDRSQTAAQSDIHNTDATETSVHQTTNNAYTENAGIIIIGAGMAGSRFAIELARAQQQSLQSKSAILDSVHSDGMPSDSVNVTAADYSD